jgi:hypothetical protein
MKLGQPAYNQSGRFSPTLILLLLSATAGAQSIDFGKSYINVTKGLSGGTLETGDTVEIRAAFVVRSNTYDSCAYYDAIPAGTAYIPNTIRVLTNEGKIYKQFTDGQWDDEGWIAGTSVRINLGYNQAASPARWNRRGRVANTHRPSFYGSTCIMIASFRVRITASTGTSISTGGGQVTYKLGTNALQTFTFPNNSILVYRNYGMCANAVGTNALGTEFNGTFGGGKSRNRGTSANVPPSYTYSYFTTNGPNDYYYGIANNTSTLTNYTTSNSWAKPDNSSPTHRVFNVWDIIGDHTDAANTALGNPAADTVTNNNGGYMLVINASYRIDSAFQQTISNLCPNTYYEISVWMRNICSKCGCDSAGRGTGTSGYIPTAPGDSSGVYPNLTFEVNGLDYYTTGNLLYNGQWVKKGFTFLTGPSQTSFTLKIFNNAPGGGGNDWALDDISVASCIPNLAFTPTNQPTVCNGNVVDFGAYIRSYFDNYIHFKWQKSIDNGISWSDDGSPGTGTPVWNGSAWEYFVAYPQFVATMADSGMRFRVVVASTSTNLSSPNCGFTGLASELRLNVIDCGVPLTTDIISFSGKVDKGIVDLSWTATREEEAVTYFIERSMDGRNFSTVAQVRGGGNPANDINVYSSRHTSGGMAWYRIKLANTTGGQKFSRIIKLGHTAQQLTLANVPNPFTSQLAADVSCAEAQMVSLRLIDNLGVTVRQETFTLSAGSNRVTMKNMDRLSTGIYTLQVQTGNTTLHKRVMKQ